MRDKARKKKLELDKLRMSLERKIRPFCEDSVDGTAVVHGSGSIVVVADSTGIGLKNAMFAPVFTFRPWMELTRTQIYQYGNYQWKPRRKKSPLHYLAECI